MVSIPLSPKRFGQEAYLAITDFRSYRLIFQQSVLRGLFFLAYLAVATGLMSTLSFSWHLLPSVYDFLNWAQVNFPPMTIQAGRLSVEGEQPLVLEYLGDQVYTFVFDTTQSHEPLHKLNEPAVVFSEENLYILAEGQTHTWPWNQLADSRLGRQELVGIEEVLRWFYYPMAFSTFSLLAFLGKLIQAALLTLFGISASARFGIRLPFSHYLNIAIYSLTPAVAVDLIVVSSGQEVPYFSLIYMATAALYTFLATQKCLSFEE